MAAARLSAENHELKARVAAAGMKGADSKVRWPPTFHGSRYQSSRHCTEVPSTCIIPVVS